MSIALELVMYTHITNIQKKNIISNITLVIILLMVLFLSAWHSN
nr:MAG TPA: hypothetical protein [Caudoviricetes sp.]